METIECPWCGEDSGIKAIHKFDAWLEEHVIDCEPFLKENDCEG